MKARTIKKRRHRVGDAILLHMKRRSDSSYDSLMDAIELFIAIKHHERDRKQRLADACMMLKMWPICVPC